MTNSAPTLPPDLEAAVAELERRRLARASLLDFTRHTYAGYTATWYHQRWAAKLNDFALGRIKRLMVFAPPRHGKSELVSRRLPAYIFGINPDARIIAGSYAADLARQMGRSVQRIMDSQEYQHTFPNTKLEGSNVRTVSDGRWLRNSDEFEIVGRKGFYKCSGVGGGITGRGFDFGIIDDPVKDAAEAWSETVRNAVWEWYTQVFLTRQEGNASILLTMTRWHHDDLAGRILAAEADRWDIVRFPALSDDYAGGALWPEKYSREWLENQKQSIGPRSFEALYQQRPAVSGGGVWPVDKLAYWRDLPHCDQIIQSWDFAAKETMDGSFTVGQVWGLRGATFYLLDQFRARTQFQGMLGGITAMLQKWPQTSAVLVEDKAAGQAVIEVLRARVSGLIPVKPEGGKEVRAQAVDHLFHAGNVCVPHPDLHPWVREWVAEVEAFPNGAQDDQVDAASQGLVHLDTKKTGAFGAASNALHALFG